MHVGVLASQNGTPGSSQRRSCCTQTPAISDSVMQVQSERGARAAYARVEQNGGFDTDVTDELAAFFATIGTAFLATASAAGQPYVQHRGGPRGFIKRVDAHTLGFVDFTGNGHFVTTGNLEENDQGVGYGARGARDAGVARPARRSRLARATGAGHPAPTWRRSQPCGPVSPRSGPRTAGCAPDAPV